jgi:hypothetical protein
MCLKIGKIKNWNLNLNSFSIKQIIGEIIHLWFEAIAFQQFECRWHQPLPHLWTVENVDVEEDGMMRVKEHVGSETESLHQSGLKLGGHEHENVADIERLLGGRTRVTGFRTYCPKRNHVYFKFQQSSLNIHHNRINLLRDCKELDANSVGIIGQIQENEYGSDDQQASGQFYKNNPSMLIVDYMDFL